MATMPAAFGITSVRVTEPEEVPALVTFLVSPLASNVLGADLVIDGGIVKTTQRHRTPSIIHPTQTHPSNATSI